MEFPAFTAAIENKYLWWRRRQYEITEIRQVEEETDYFLIEFSHKYDKLSEDLVAVFVFKRLITYSKLLHSTYSM